MADGAILKAYINGKNIKREVLAKGLKVTRQNLYQLYKSIQLKPETKSALERELKAKWSEIESAGQKFINDNIGVNVSREKDNARVVSFKTQGGQDYKDGYIAALDKMANSSGKRVLLYARTNQALLRTVFQSLAR